MTLAVTAPGWLPWLDPRQDLWAADDAAIHMIRLHHILWLIGEGVWFPRWIPDMFRGYGYPLLNYYAPGSYYAGWALHALLRLDVWDAFRGAGALGALSLAGGSYALVTGVWGRPALGVLAALIVVYGPYTVQMNLFQRGNVPELLSLSFLPWLLAAIWHLWQARGCRERAWWAAGVALTGAGAVLSHNLTGMATAAVAAVWVAFLAVGDPRERRERWIRTRRVAASGLLVGGLAAFFWLPALAESHYVQLNRFQTPGLDYRQWLVDVDGLTERHQRPENRQSRSGAIDTHAHYPHQLLAPPKISLAQAGLGVLALVTALGAIAAGKRDLKTLAIVPVLVLAIACWLLTFEESASLWRASPVLPLFQFPWRLLGPLSVCLAATGAGSLAIIQDAIRAPGTVYPAALRGGVVGVVAAGVLFNSLGDRRLNLAAVPPERFTVQAVRAEEQDRGTGGTTGVAEFLPVGVAIPEYTPGSPRVGPVFERLFPEADWLGGRLRPLTGDLRLLDWRITPHSLEARVANDGTDSARLAVRQLWFPGWRAWLDGRTHPLLTAPSVPEQEASLGLIVLDVPPGEHSLALVFGPTPVRAAATAVSVLAGMALVGVLWWGSGRSAGSAVLCGGAILLLVYAAWRTLRPALGPEGGAPGLLLNVAEEIRSGRAEISAPSGARLGRDSFVDVRQLTVPDASDPGRGYPGTSRRQWLYAHPPAALAVQVSLPKTKSVWFQAAIALDPSVWDGAEGDGVDFRVLVADAPGGVQTVLERTVNPRSYAEHRRWIPIIVDLSAWSGKDVRLTLETLPRNDATLDWAGWGNPVVVVWSTSRGAPAS